MKTVSVTPVVLKHHRRKDGTFPVKIRITFDRASRYINTTITAGPGDLTRSLSIKSPSLLNKVSPLVAEIRESISGISPFDLDGMNVDDVVGYIRGDLGKARFRLDFIAWGREWARKEKTGTTLGSYLQALSALERFAGGPVDINAVTRSFLLDFVEYVEKAPKVQYNRKAGTWTERDGIMKQPGGASARHIAKLSHMYSAARLRFNDEDAGVLLVPRDPFAGVRHSPPPAAPTPLHAPLPCGTVQRIIDAAPADRSVREALDLFLLSLVTMGANLADLHEAPAMKSGAEWWVYHRKKTRNRRSDRAEIRVRITPQAAALLDRLQDGPRGWMVPALHRIGTRCDTATGKVNKRLRAWCESEGLPPFSFYAARHTFATLARREGVEKATIDEALGHVGDFDLTDIYAVRSWDLINGAGARVVSLFDWTAVTK